ncbi:MAG: 4-carboxymuconolactone decarboxylase [bacterium]|nr:4-carboxymuconolactone decarboxylase [bacterium]
MMSDYYEKKDLADFSNIGEYAEEEGKKFFEYYEQVASEGRLTEREKALIALSVAAVRKCPYCIDAYTNKLLSLGVPKEEMMEAVHVGAAMQAGITPA